MKTLSPVAQRFILHWGEMGTRWGVNRTVAQIHALLYISQQPLPADEISEILNVARSNVSTSIKELQSWGIVRTVHVLNDRRDHFESMKDVWEMLRVVLNERKKRELDPTLVVLRECVANADQSQPADKYTKEKLGELLELVETTSSWYSKVKNLPAATLKKFVKMGDQLCGLLGFDEK
jgi:DNA-binding transcriptional regulator GbsR (MarR family)